MARVSRKIPLAGWYVISTRPLHQHGGVRRAAARLGARVFAVSTLSLRPLVAGAALREALRCELVIATSPAAVRLAHAQQPLATRRGQRWFALGAGSASAMKRCGVSEVTTPAHGSDSEALLALPALRGVRGRSIGLLTAPGGRGLLHKRLRARGARLVVAPVYQRDERPVPASRLRALATLGARTALLLTSAEAFEPLWRELPEPARARLRGRPCVVASERLAAYARALGFDLVLRADDAQPASLLAALSRHVSTGGFR
jgi:uroporphyrinogen-III synthase